MKIAIVDIETSSLNADFGVVLCCGIKQYEKRGVKMFRADAYPTWNHHRSDDKRIVKDIIEELDSYDIIIAHNGQYFDKAFLNAKCVKYGIFPRLRFKKFIDPVLVARRHMKVGRRSLAALSGFLDVDLEKSPLKVQYWVRASHDGDRTAMQYICMHCEMDVKVLESVYTKVKNLIDKIDSRGSS